MNNFLLRLDRSSPAGDATKGRRLSALIVGLAVAAVASLPAEAEVAGAVAAVRVWAYGTPPDDAVRRDLFLRDEVFVREVLETVADGALHVRLMDDTMLRLGSGSRVVVDEFVYSPAADSATLLARITKGVCRFVSGKAATRRLEVMTPAATIAARGTEFSVWVAADGSTTVWVQSGEVEVIPLDGAPPTEVGAGEIVLAPIAGGGVQRDAARPAPDPGIADTSRVRIRRGKELR
jgi:hypothetical protein